MAKGDKKQPWFKFYPSDWSGDRKLHMCSVAARGLWIELMCVMHEAEPYGFLITDGKPVTNRQIAALVGLPLTDAGKLLAELESAGVYSRDENGVIYSRRMVKDKAKSKQASDWGKGGGNPQITNTDKEGVNPPVNPAPNHSLKPQSPEARNTDTETRACLISPEAFEITAALERACGFNLPEEVPPGWVGCALWVQKCLNEGWIGAVMIEATKGVVRRKRNGFVEHFKYLEKPLAEAMAQHLAPLPQVEIRQPEKLTVTANGKQQSGNIIQAADRLLDKIRSFDAGPGGDDGVRDGAGATSPRLLSQG